MGSFDEDYWAFQHTSGGRGSSGPGGGGYGGVPGGCLGIFLGMVFGIWCVIGIFEYFFFIKDLCRNPDPFRACALAFITAMTIWLHWPRKKNRRLSETNVFIYLLSSLILLPAVWEEGNDIFERLFLIFLPLLGGMNLLCYLIKILVCETKFSRRK